MSEATLSKEQALRKYLLRMGDNAVILSQRLSEWVGHGPELEEEMAMANFALDLVGQARMMYSQAAELEGQGRSEDDIAFLRDSADFTNLLLLEQPNGDFGETITRLVLFELFYSLQLDALENCSAPSLAAIASKARKESDYHLRHSAHWLVRLGDGTEESHRRVQESLDRLWCYTGEMFEADAVDRLVQDAWNGPDLDQLKTSWQSMLHEILARATLRKPEDQWMDGGGKQGNHSEHLGYILAEMQFLQRAYPGASW
ncbi:MAG: 1,2-phenylacetyl-CoA epoxidase subunit PaaC [Gammaproteobacteria bacterium]